MTGLLLVRRTDARDIQHLPFESPEPPKKVAIHPPEAPPIGRYLQRNPWLLPKLLRRDIPA